MKYPIFFLLIAVVVAGCSKPTTSIDTNAVDTAPAPTPPTEYPTLVIDDQHQVNGSNPPVAYHIAAAAGIRLDATQFHFTYGTNPITPDMVQLLGGGSVYELAHSTITNIYTVDATTLQPLRGGAFHGFHSGDHLFLAIGRSTMESDKIALRVSWVGKLEVK